MSATTRDIIHKCTRCDSVTQYGNTRNMRLKHDTKSATLG